MAASFSRPGTGSPVKRVRGHPEDGRHCGRASPAGSLHTPRRRARVTSLGSGIGMPLRAVVEGRAVQVWDLTAEEWAGLRPRAKADTVVMACCGAPGLAKTSRNGNPFFAHRGRRITGA